MTRSALIRAVARRTGTTQQEARRVVDAVFRQLVAALCEGRRVEIRGFGTFRARHYPAYAARNPRTGEAVEARPKVLPVFRAGKDLLRRVNAEED